MIMYFKIANVVASDYIFEQNDIMAVWVHGCIILNAVYKYTIMVFEHFPSYLPPKELDVTGLY